MFTLNKINGSAAKSRERGLEHLHALNAVSRCTCDGGESYAARAHQLLVWLIGGCLYVADIAVIAMPAFYDLLYIQYQIIGSILILTD